MQFRRPLELSQTLLCHSHMHIIVQCEDSTKHYQQLKYKNKNAMSLKTSKTWNMLPKAII